MAQFWDTTAAACVLGGLAVLALSSRGFRRWRESVPVALELWTAAGLLKLASERSWSRIAAVAIIVVLRRLLWGWGLGRPRERAP